MKLQGFISYKTITKNITFNGDNFEENTYYVYMFFYCNQFSK